MTIVNNGDRRSLVIPGVFAGTCGISRGRLAFGPVPPAIELLRVYAATIDGRPVVLSNVQPAGDGRSYIAQVLG